jgi:hypothetical protein
MQAAEGARELVEAVPPEEWLLLEGGNTTEPGAEPNSDGVPSAHRFRATLGPPPPESPAHEGVRLLFEVLAGLMPAGASPRLNDTKFACGVLFARTIRLTVLPRVSVELYCILATNNCSSLVATLREPSRSL